MSRILLLTFEFSPFHGGVGTYAEMIARAAHDAGHEVTVLAPDYGQRLEAADRESHPFRVVRFHGHRYAAADTPATAWRSWRTIRDGDFEVVHAVDLAHIVALGLVSRFRRVSYFATVHGSEILGASRAKQNRLLRLHDLFTLPVQVFTNSEYTRALLLSHYPKVDATRVKPTLLGVDPYWFLPGEGAEARERLGIERHRRIVLTVARLEPRKGHRTVIRALGLLPARLRKQMLYVVVGTGAQPRYRTELERLAVGCGVPVRFLGEIDRTTLRALYSTAELFCMPGESDPTSVEGFGLAYLEAAAQGVPAVGTTIGGVPEVVRDGETGILLPPGSPVAVASTLERLLTDTDLTAALGGRARAWAQGFTWARCAAQTYGAAP